LPELWSVDGKKGRPKFKLRTERFMKMGYLGIKKEKGGYGA
jgi:hypothetical protein